MSTNDETLADLEAELHRVRASIGANSRRSQGDMPTDTTAARAALWQKYLDQVDPHGELPEDERERRAYHARKADMGRLALKSVMARRAKARKARLAEMFGDEAAV
jgi:hypothetical protein